jgi:hypothetical protein
LFILPIVFSLELNERLIFAVEDFYRDASLHGNVHHVLGTLAVIDERVEGQDQMILVNDSGRSRPPSREGPVVRRGCHCGC